MLKNPREIVLTLAVIAAGGSSLLAGSWSHVQDTAGTYSATVTVTASANVVQICDSYESNNGTINDGPLGDLTVNGIGYKSMNGTEPAGMYGVYQSVTQPAGGESSTYFNW